MNVKRINDVVRLQELAQMVINENERLVEELLRAKRENLLLRGATPEQLQQELTLLEKRLVAESEQIEQRADEQLAKEKAAREKLANKRRPRERSGPRPEQATLEVVEVVHDFDDADRKCRECGGDTTPWEGQDDVTEEVDVITRQFVIKKHIRKKQRCKCGCVESAETEPRLVPGGRYSNAFAVEIATMKYVDQLPLERIVKIVGREGLVIDSQTLWDQVNALAAKLAPAQARLREVILQAPVIGMDQSPWKVLGHQKTWQMWTLTTTKLAYFDICETKGWQDGARVLGDYAGIVVGDAASTHDALASRTGITLAHCWAHVLRDAEKLEVSDPIRAMQLIGFIRKLYDVDEEAGDDDDKRLALRQSKSRGVIADLNDWRLAQRPLPSSPMSKLLGYLVRHRPGLERFLDDARIPLDNNQSERGYCWVAVGRRSFFGSRSKRGTEVAALFYGLAESARRNGVDPGDYFGVALRAALAGQTIPLPNELG